MINIKSNSKKVTNGDIFIAIKGNNHDGHDYIEEAIENGASRIICEYGKYNIDTLIVKDTKEYLKNYIKENYCEKIKNIKFIGVTGTNGKTTTCYIIYQMLREFGIKSAYIGTIGFYIEEKIKDLDRTTPELIDLYDMFLECKENNVEYIVMEVSSHALELDRVYGIKYDYAVFTNLTEDHLIFHNNMENYLNAKLKLFDKIKENGYAIINIDDSYSQHFLAKNNNNITYGRKKSDYNIIKYKLKINFIQFKLKNNNKIYKTKINIPGKYNIYNFVAAISVLNKIGYSLKEILKITKNIELPKGRMQLIKYKNNSIIIDYAHTPDAVMNVLNSANKYKENKIYTIIGCGGERDRGKRKLMGKISSDLSDYAIFTNDNPRFEDEEDIMKDITSELNNNNYEVIYDRSMAIKKGISLLKRKDILFVLGKGHETYQIVKEKEYHFDDYEEVMKNIQK